MNKHLFPYKWKLSDGYNNQNKGRVFGTFICGGGSSMGYKLAGFDHIGGVEIDPKVASVYKKNHRPEYLYIEDIRDFNKRDDLPEELYNLDILDGSPPCSTFSISGSREKSWGRKKKFREGQALQTLDDLVFEYCKTINKLQPKIFLLENVKGIIAGNAKWYSKQVVKLLNNYGYTVQVFKLDSSTMGVPQRRERVFFIGHKKELQYPKLKLEFNEEKIVYRNIIGPHGKPLSERDNGIWAKRVKNDNSFSDTLERLGEKRSSWSIKYIHQNKVCVTIMATNSKLIDYEVPCYVSDEKIKQIGTYPIDYDFQGVNVNYLVGMSVPPVMIAHIASQIYAQWLSIQTSKMAPVKR